MPHPTMALGELAETSADAGVLCQMVQFMAQRLMELAVKARCAAGYDEKSPERTYGRIGFRDRTWETRGGSVGLHIPRLSCCLTQLFCHRGLHQRCCRSPQRGAAKALADVSS